MAVWLLAASGAAQEADPGRAHFQAGSAYFDTGEYEDALREWERAYQLSQRAELFYNISLAHERLGNLDQATEFLRRYLAEVEEIENRSTLERRVESFERRLAEQREREQEQPPPNQPPPPQERRDLPPAQPPAPTPADEGGGIPVPTWIAWGVGAAGLVAAGVFVGLAFAEDSTLADDCAGGICSGEDVSSLELYALLADIGWATALVGGGVGLIFLLTADSGDADQAAGSLRVTPWAGPGSVGLSMGGAL